MSRSQFWRSFVIAVTMVVAAAGCVGVAQAAPATSLVRLDTTAPPISGAQRVSDVPGSNILNIGIVLTPLNVDLLDQLADQVNTPGSPNYGQFLTPQQYLDQFAPPDQLIGLIKVLLSSAGLNVTGVSDNRQVIDASGTVAAIQALLGITFGVYQDGTEKFYSNDGIAGLPTWLAPFVAAIVGLDDRVQAQPGRTTATTPSGLSPAQINAAYRFNQLGATGAGQTVALWEFDGYSNADLNAYNAQWGLSGPAVSTVSVDGANYDASPGGGKLEVELDSEVVRAIAPQATQLIYEAPNSGTGWVDMANKIATDDRATAISISWGECEPDAGIATQTAINNAFAQAAAEGMSIFSASGDNGSADCTRSASGAGVTAVDFPGSDVYDTSVGGTSLTQSSGTYASEKAWSNGGGGVSATFQRPSWQPGSNAMRTVPDVSSVADPNTGFAIYSGGAWVIAGGTSAAAPTWAAYTMLYNQKAAALGKNRLGFANPALYSVGTGANKAAAFHDVTTGSNGAYSATTGYDEVTGLGSPIADGLTNALLGTTTANTVSVTNPGAQSSVVGSSVSLAITANDSGNAALTYTAGGLPAGLSINASTGVISGSPTTIGSSTVTITATDATKATASTSFTWAVTSAACAAGNRLTNPGFESGNTGWTAGTGVIGQHSPKEPAHTGTWDAVLDGTGTAHTDTLSQSLAIPGGCTISVGFALHVDTAETTTTAKNDTLTIKLGSVTLGTYSNLNAGSGWYTYTYTVSGLSAQTAALTFTGTENGSLQTSFVIDDTSLTAS